MAAHKKNYDDALMTLKDYVRFGKKTDEEIAVVEDEARRLGGIYSDRSTRFVDVEDDIRTYREEGRGLRDEFRTYSAA